jgi:ubiquitin carboxyl-terminal hydrolase MINDY-1/2
MKNAKQSKMVRFVLRHKALIFKASAVLVRHFLDHTQSQMTYHGLFTLATTVAPDSLVALFRNLHLSVLYKPEGEDQSLYSLVTDHSFLREPSVVWERLEDVDGGWSTFVDSDFVKSSPAGGDFVGQTAEDALRAAELQYASMAVSDPAEYETVLCKPAPS